MPSIKRKQPPATSSAGPSKRKQQMRMPVGVKKKEDNTMMRLAMEDDMIDEDDEEDEEDEDGFQDEGEDQEDSEGAEGADFEDMEGTRTDETSKASSKGKGKAEKNGLFKPPTAEEMRLLRSREDRGGAFDTGMKINALLQSTLLQPTSTSKPPPGLTSFLTSIHTHLLSLPSLPPLPLKMAVQRLQPVKIPFTKPSPMSEKEPAWKLGWEKPTEVFVAGSWGVVGGYKREKKKVGSKWEVGVGKVDLAVLMPDDMFTPKDRLSNRYFHKRAHYLAVIASSLVERVKNAIGDDAWRGVVVEWEYLGGDARRPVVLVTLPKDKARGLKHRHSIRLIPTIRPGLFPLTTLHPTKSNLRIVSSSNVSTETFSPSPRYNTSILLDTTQRAHLLACHALNKSSPAFKPALALWRIWGERRGLIDRSGGGLNGWGWTGQMVLGMVVEGGNVAGKNAEIKAKKGLGRGLTEWQLFKAGLELLASTDFNKTPVFMKVAPGAETIPNKEYIAAFRDVFVDPTGTINVWANWEQGELQLLRHEARTTLLMLADSHDHFDDMFLRSLHSSALRFDEVLRLDIREYKERKPPSDLIEIREGSLEMQRRSAVIASTLRRGLGDRARLVTTLIAPPPRWTCDLDGPAHTITTAEVGLLLDKTEANRVLDQGPTAEEPDKAAAFRDFWGEKAGLRRFKDGSITESVIWQVSRPEERALISGQVVSWLINRHFNLSAASVSWSSPRMQQLLQIPESSHRLKMVEGSEKLGFRTVMDAFDKLYKVIKAADDDLPLSILNFSPASEYLRYTSTFVPHPFDLARASVAPGCIRHLPTVDVIMQFESSRKWPDDLVAIQKVKLAFMEKLARLLQGRIADVRVNIVLESGAPDIQDHACLEVIVPEGFAYHLRIYHDRERTLLLRMVEDDDLPSPKLRKIALDCVKLHARRFTLLPRHHAAMATLHHMHPSFASASRLLKRWISSHMLSSHLSAEFAELMVASVYLLNGPSGAPTSAGAAFYRAIYRLAHWDWKEEPMVVPLYSATTDNQDSEATGATTATMPSDLLAKALSQFAAERKADPQCVKGALRVVTEEDLDGTAWTIPHESGRLLAGRVVALAEAACDVLEASGLDATNPPVEIFFKTPLSHFDFLLHLNPSAVFCLDQNLEAHDTNFAKKWTGHVRPVRQATGSDVVDAGLNPATGYFRDLQRLFGSNVLLFCDESGGTVIGGLWNPAIAPLRNFKPFLGFSSKPTTGDGKKSSSLVEADKQDMLDEMARLGTGIVTKVEVLK